MKLDSIGTLFAKSWERYRERFSVLFTIFLLPAFLVCIGEVLIAQQTLPALALGGLLNLLGVIVSIAASIAMIAAVGKGQSFFDAYKTGFKLFWASIWIGILFMLAYFGGFILLIIPGIIIAVQLSFMQYVLVMEDKHGMAALAESREYIKGYWWAFVGRAFLLGLVYFAVILVIYLPARVLFGGVGAAIAYGIIMLLISPFSIAYSYEIFDNLRRMKPDAAEAAAKADKGFLKVCMVVGIVGFVGFIMLFFAAVIFLPSVVSNLHTTTPNEYNSTYPPAMATTTANPYGFVPGTN